MQEDRKKEEARFHNEVRDKALSPEEYERLNSNKKYYTISRGSRNYKFDYLIKNGKGKRVLDFCCGDGDVSVMLAQNGVEVYGIDISDGSIENAKKQAEQKGVSDKYHFSVMDAENMTFENNFFDYIACFGVLHHLDIDKAYKEMARVLKPDGHVICSEPLVYNPIFHLYRKMTPQLRTEWEVEHILRKREIDLSQKYFNKIEPRFFHLFTLFAVPFRNKKGFGSILKIMERIDSFILRITGIRWLAWQIVFILSEPKK